MTVKLTIVYGNPTDEAAFEEHYRTRHAELAASFPDVLRVETAKVFPKEDGSPRPRWRTADLYFSDYDTACRAFLTPEAKAVLADAREMATGGVEFLLSDIELSGPLS